MGSKSPDSFTAGSHLIATYDLSVAGSAGVTGLATFADDVTVTGSVSASSLSVAGHANVSGSTKLVNISASTLATTGNSSVTGSLSASALSVGGNAAVTGSVSASSLSITGHTSITGSLATGIAGISLTADNAFSPLFVAASHAPGATDYAYPGTLWILTTFSGAAGSTVANGCWYMNTSASGATGSSWTVLAAMVAS